MSITRTPSQRTGAPARRSFTPKFVAAVSIVAAAAVLVATPGASAAQAPVELGTATSFAVLAGSGITNTGPTTINGDVGSSPTPSETGFSDITLNGENHAGDAVTMEAKTDLTAAYNQAFAATPTTAVVTELGGTTLTPGVYGSETLGITGTLTLDTLGDPNAVFIFKSNETLITAADSAVIVLNGAQACNVFWQVASSATLGVDSSLIGTVMAGVSITATTRATIQGRLLAGTGAVTLDTNTITRNNCEQTTPTTTTTSTTTPTTATTAPVTPDAVPGGDTSTNGTPGGGDTTGATPGGGTPGEGTPGTPGEATPNTPGTTTSNGIPPRLAFSGNRANTSLTVFGFAAITLGVALTAGPALRRRRSAS